MDDKLRRLSEISQSNVELRNKLLNHENYSFERVAYGQTLSNWTNAWNEYLNNKSIENAKQIFNESGFIDLKRAEMFNHRLFDMQNPRDNFCCVALSDNVELQNLYTKIDYQIKYISRNKEIKISFREFAKKGELVAILSLCIMNALDKDLNELKNSLLIFKNTIDTKKQASILLPDYEFLESLLTKDKDKIKKRIEQFITPKLHKERMRDELLLSDYISLPAILYLKLCWILDFQIEINHEFIPMDFMPIRPLNKYNETYKELIK